MSVAGAGDAPPEGLWNPARIALDLRDTTLVSMVDMARWMAALLGYGDLAPDGRPLWVQAWFFFTGMHAEAVLVFFVLSGFLVGGLSAARISAGRFDPPGYAIDRFSRLYIGFLPALALTLMLDSIGSRWLGASGLYDGTHPMLMIKDPGKIFAANLGWETIAGNLLMVQDYFVKPLGSNGPLWTLSNEFWFYAVFGLALAATIARGARRAALVVAALAVCAILGPQFLGYFGMWLIGAAAACIAPKRAGPPWLPAFAFLGYLALIRAQADLIADNLTYLMAAHYVLALVFAWLLLAIRGRQIRLMERLAGMNRFEADFSYSLYLIHFPLLLFSIALLGRITGLAGFFMGFSPTDPAGVAAYIGIAVFIIAASWLFAQITERRTPRLRDWLKRYLIGHRP